MPRRRLYGSRAPMVGGAKRKTSWLELVPTSASVSASTSVLLLSLTTAEKARRPFTIVRTHWEIVMANDAIGGGITNLIGAVGACVVTDQAEAVGITAIPTPITDLASDQWFLHQMMLSSQIEQGTDGMTYSNAKYSIDSKAMRKVDDSEDVVFIVESGAVSFTIVHGGRLLIKEN